MSDKIDMQVFDSYNPPIDSGEEFEIGVSQNLKKGSQSLLALAGATAIKARIAGPQLKLEPAHVAGVFPAPGSEESSDEFLSHVALARRTLPWERIGPDSNAPKPSRPWLALLLVSEDEMPSTTGTSSVPPSFVQATTVGEIKPKDKKTYDRLHAKLNLPDDTAISCIDLPNELLPEILPLQSEVELLCHVKRTRNAQTGDDEDVAIVVGHRLPNAERGIHTALLVSLEQADDLYEPDRYPNGQRTSFVVLHHWSFTPSGARDFEAVMQAIRYQPNGGVLRFGNLPAFARGGGQGPLSGGFDALLDDNGFFAEPLAHDQVGSVTFRSALRPFPVGPRSKGFAVQADPEEFEQAPPGTPVDFSHAVAFELGRLLALADAGILEDLRNTSLGVSLKDDIVAVNKLPPALQKPDWVVNPEFNPQEVAQNWWQEPWTLADGQALVKGEAAMNEIGVADFSGITAEAKIWQGEVIAALQSVSVPTGRAIAEVDIGNVTGEALSKQFVDVVNAAQS